MRLSNLRAQYTQKKQKNKFKEAQAQIAIYITQTALALYGGKLPEKCDALSIGFIFFRSLCFLLIKIELQLPEQAPIICECVIIRIVTGSPRLRSLATSLQ